MTAGIAPGPSNVSLVRSIMSLYEGARIRVRVDSVLSDEFDANVGMHQGSLPLPFVFGIGGRYCH